MNKNFSEWYRTANIEPTDEMLQNRWQGVQNYLEKKFDCSDVLNLVRLFFVLPVDIEFLQGFIVAFNEVDHAFPKKNKLELSVLAGSTLVEIINEYEDFDDLALAEI